MASKSASAVDARNGLAWTKVTIAMSYAGSYVAVGLYQLPHTVVTARLSWRLYRLKSDVGNGIAASAGKLNAPLPGSIAIVVWIAFLKSVKDHIVHSFESFSSNTIWT